MTMVICKECKSPISSKTDACLHCGARQRKTPRLATIAVVLLGATLLTNTALLWRLYQFESQTTPPGAYAATPG
mgnify:CR=1 FL=1|jgi:hypothetical protein